MSSLRLIERRFRGELVKVRSEMEDELMFVDICSLVVAAILMIRARTDSGNKPSFCLIHLPSGQSMRNSSPNNEDCHGHIPADGAQRVPRSLARLFTTTHHIHHMAIMIALIQKYYMSGVSVSLDLHVRAQL